MLHPRLQRIFSIMTAKTSVEQSELELVNVGVAQYLIYLSYADHGWGDH